MDISSLGYRTDLRLLELAGSEVIDRGEYVVARTPRNPAFWWGNFLLFRTPFGPGGTTKRLALFQSEFPEAKHVALGIDSVDGVVGAEDELLAAGIQLERNSVMTASRVIEPARPNEAAEYRQLTGDGDWGQLTGLSLASATMTVDQAYEDFCRGRTRSARELVESGQGFWFGAFEGERLLASLGLVPDGQGAARFQNVQTHSEARNRGLASTLVHRAAAYGLNELGAKTLVMVADPEYVAIRIYRALGFEDTETQIQLVRPAS
ncbi:GNAT family N-acetyltransferase [Kribbella monticola]|uniref:GNAT family N-acetyltransferase n=1 Tax=Kribbella monticola TaxID=2185285 RepID=UPI000DD2E184|nr:GNAT family N-acetyltransferase [Kribbella monticola]